MVGILQRVLRSPQEEPPTLVAVNNGDVAVFDENTEILTSAIEEIGEMTTEEEGENRDDLAPIVCNPEDENCNNADFDRK